MKKALKSLARILLPAPLYARLTAISARRWIERVERTQGLDALTQRYIAACGRTVLRGPFQGMTYSPLADRRHIGARLLGCYEQEIAPAVERCCGTEYAQVIDVGCAEGYYAIGFARRIPTAQVTAFDTDPWARRACRDLAALNNVSERVSVRGFCSAEKLQASLGEGRALLVLDCEGYEATLLDPELVPGLAQCDMIVELHDAPATPDHLLVQRFRETHDVELIPSVPRTTDDAAPLDQFSPAEQLALMDEMRHAWQGWAIFTRK
ncbi:MAG TPA: 50S ribosomal protein L11 methyltransferase [Chthoniobacterales bacterium]|nr:50S ribosomal protein L11 methyltransferase [Chthoniobacterales bacterium]